MLLEGKTAIVYGAGGAVGGTVARVFAREGARVFLAGRRREPLEAVAQDIYAGGGKAEVMPVDALDAEAVRGHFAAVADRAGPVRVMFNAIDWGDTQGEQLANMSLERFEGPVHSALRTWFITGTEAARHMAANGGGSIVGITANAGRTPIAMVGGFGVACAAVEHFLRQLGIEMGPAGVRVSNVRSAGSPDAPGVREALTLRANEAGTTLAEIERLAGEGTALRRLPALAEVADAAVFLASDYSRAMTATSANVTCGQYVD